MGLYLVVVISVAACPFGHGGLLDLSVPRGLLGHSVPDHGLPLLFGVLGPLLLGPFPGFVWGGFGSWGRVFVGRSSQLVATSCTHFPSGGGMCKLGLFSRMS